MRSQPLGLRQFWVVLIISAVVAMGLLAVGMVRNESLDFWYLASNLVLGLVPLLFAIWIEQLLKKRRWTHWFLLVITFLWLLFLPNSFYIVSDFIHLTETPRVDIVQDVVMLMQFSFIGVTLGCVSLAIVHKELIKRTNARLAAVFAGVILWVCSFAIYIGRDLRWNSWDIFIQPTAIIGDVFGLLTDPFARPQGLITTISFFVMMGSIYLVFWQLLKGTTLHDHKKEPVV